MCVQDFVVVESMVGSGTAAEEVRYALSEFSRALAEDKVSAHAGLEYAGGESPAWFLCKLARRQDRHAVTDVG